MRYRYWNYSFKYRTYHINLSVNIGDDPYVGNINQYGLGLFVINYNEHFHIHAHLLGIRLRINIEYFPSRNYGPGDENKAIRADKKYEVKLKRKWVAVMNIHEIYGPYARALTKLVNLRILFFMYLGREPKDNADMEYINSGNFARDVTRWQKESEGPSKIDILTERLEELGISNIRQIVQVVLDIYDE